MARCPHCKAQLPEPLKISRYCATCGARLDEAAATRPMRSMPAADAATTKKTKPGGGAETIETVSPQAPGRGRLVAGGVLIALVSSAATVITMRALEREDPAKEIAVAPPSADDLSERKQAEVYATGIRYVMRSHQSQITGCYERSFKDEDVSPGGRVEVAFTIGKDGRAKSVEVLSNSTGKEPLGSCLA